MVTLSNFVFLVSIFYAKEKTFKDSTKTRTEKDADKQIFLWTTCKFYSV